MGMFDTICNVPVKCPICGNEEPKSVQIKSGLQTLENYKFKEDKIDINWDHGSVIDKEKRIIRGIAICNKCMGDKDTFDVAIWLDTDNIPIAIDIVEKINRR